jgi:inorganic pyrophosphatase
MSSAFATIVILAAGFTGIAFALFQFRRIARIRLNDTAFSETANLNDGDGSEDKMAKLIEIYEAIRQGADSFLFAEYKICAVFLVAFGFLVLILCSRTSENGEVAWQWTSGVLTSISFCAGGVTSIVSGYIGMKVRRQRSRVLAAAALYRSRTAQVAVFSNARTTVSAMMPDPWKESFNTAFRAGSVMGFSLCGIGLLSLYLICNVYTLSFDWTKSESCKLMFECVSGFGLGGSAIALFGRVGGGIYTKAADVGADLAGKVVENIPEDDPRNPAVIADNVGDNVGDVRLHHADCGHSGSMLRLLRQANQGRWACFGRWPAWARTCSARSRRPRVLRWLSERRRRTWSTLVGER